MPNQFRKPHLFVNKYSKPLSYIYPRNTIISFKVVERDRKQQGNKILSQLTQLDSQLSANLNTANTQGLIQDDAIYVQFYSEWDYELMFDQLHDKSKQRYQIVNIKKEEHPDNPNKTRYSVLVMMTKGGISHFINRTQKYLTENTKSKGEYTDTPVANKLISNIKDFKTATLEAFWTDSSHYEFPETDKDVWWEVWLRNTEDFEKKVVSQLNAVEAKIGESVLKFEEHIICLVKGTAVQLSSSLMLLDNLMEIRKPQEMNDFITHHSVTYNDKKEWMQDLIDRTDVNLDDDSVLICLLDTGVNNKHPLLNHIIPDDHLYAYNAAWGISDSEGQGGHGTAMSGLALYGDLTDALPTTNRIQIYHGVESFKVKNPQNNTNPTLFGSIYKSACATPIIDRPNNPRIYTLTVTNDGFSFYGRPSAHSAALDSITFGNGISKSELVFVSGGTLNYNKASDYPNQNFLESVKDPGQAYNVVTVGSYTIKDKLLPGAEVPLVRFGGMSANNSTSGTWETQWPNKPDIVLEGGNIASDGINLWLRNELKPLSLDKDFANFIFLPFDGTCSATAFASKMAAEIKRVYPSYWSETIRGLMIHSASWTKEMVRDINLKSLLDRRALVRSVGYGVPSLSKALFSANNSLTMISENHITPYKLKKSTVAYNEYHLYGLPWPIDVLRDEVAENDVRITVTLSYFIEPNPGHRQYANNFSYHSHNLDFKLIKPTESLDEFKRRISRASKKEGEDKPNLKSSTWTIREKVRSKGSIKKDYIDTNGVELSERRYLAIYPKSGWYRSRKRLKKYDSKVRYSLIISIDTQKTDVDIYTPVEIQIKVPIAIKI